MSTDVEKSSAIAWPHAGEHVQKRQCGPVDAAALARYAEASGDDNPLHLDLAIARRAGLEERPIHGMLIVGHFEPMVYAWRPDLVMMGLSTKFLRPVLTGQKFELSGRVVRVGTDKNPGVILRLMAHGLKADGAAGDLALVAEAQLQPKP